MEWRGIEIHPETPPAGRPLTDLFGAESIDRMMQALRLAGAPFGITFAGHPNLKPFLLPEDANFHPLRKDYTP